MVICPIAELVEERRAGQFWPNGESDGDTAKVVVGAGVFRFRPKPNGRWKITHAFDHAMRQPVAHGHSG